MRLYKRTVILLAIASVSMAHSSDHKQQQTRQVAQARDSKPAQAIPRLEIISAIPRYVIGRYDLGDIALLDSGDAWAVGYDGEHVRRVYHSRNGGKSWEALDVPGNDFTLKAISFSDSQHGWAVGGKGLIIRTTNGGATWEMLKRPTSRDLHAVHFVSSRVGYIASLEKIGDKVTDEVTGSVEILCTKDGGEDWQVCYSVNEPISILQITSFSESGAFAILGGAMLIRTDDQGSTWRVVDLSGKHVSCVALSADGAYWRVGPHGTFERSDDGRTWHQVTSLVGGGDNKNWWSIAFNSAGVGAAVGDRASIAITLDNGKTWQFPEFGIDDDLRVVRLRGKSAIVLGAKNIYSIRVAAAPKREN